MLDRFSLCIAYETLFNDFLTGRNNIRLHGHLAITLCRLSVIRSNDFCLPLSWYLRVALPISRFFYIYCKSKQTDL